MKQQQNGDDCGIHVLRFVRQILKRDMSSTDEDIKNKFDCAFHDFIFTESDANKDRNQFEIYVGKLTEAYKSYNRYLREKKARLKREKKIDFDHSGESDDGTDDSISEKNMKKDNESCVELCRCNNSESEAGIVNDVTISDVVDSRTLRRSLSDKITCEENPDFVVRGGSG